MADGLTRRRFLLDVLFVGGGLMAASLLAAQADIRKIPTPSPTPRATPTPGSTRIPYAKSGKPMPPPARFDGDVAPPQPR